MVVLGGLGVLIRAVEACEEEVPGRADMVDWEEVMYEEEWLVLKENWGPIHNLLLGGA